MGPETACVLSALAGVLVGAAIGKSIPRSDTRDLLRALGSGKLETLTRLLQLLEEPPTRGGRRDDSSS